jgi:hypothetical protein
MLSMKHIKLFENFNYELIKEDILELKQMSKQMYSYFKGKGFPVEIEEKISSEKLKELADKGMVNSGFSIGPNKKNAYQWKGGSREESTIRKVASGKWGDIPVKLHINEKEEYVMVAIPGNEVDRLLQKDGKGINLNGKGYTDIPEIVEYVNKIGVELQNMIKEKYPEMVYKFETQHGYWFIMYFGYQTTSKGGYKN